MSYNPLTPPHSNRLLSCLCNGKTKKVLFYLGLKFLIVGLIFRHGSAPSKKPIKYVTVSERTRLYEATANESCLLPNSALFPLQSLDLPRCADTEDDWLWVTVNGDVLPKEGREGAYCKKRKNREEAFTKLRFGEKISETVEVKCSDGGQRWQNYLWRLTSKESVKRELRASEGKNNLLIFEFSSIGKDEFRQSFRSTIAWLKNKRPLTELKNVHASSENYYVDGMFRENGAVSGYSKNSHATLIINREGSRNLSQFAHHYGHFRDPEQTSCLHSSTQHSKSLTVLSSFLSSYKDLPHFASVHLSAARGTDTAAMDEDLASWLEHNKHLLDDTTIVITAGGSALLDSSTTHRDILSARLPFLAISPPDEQKSQQLPSSSFALVSTSEVFSSDLQGANYRSKSCKEAGIDEKYCMCVEWRAALDSPSGVQEVIEITDALVTWINEKTLKYRFVCDIVALDEIEDATKMSISPSALRLPIQGKSDRHFVEEAFTEYKIRFTTKPGRKLYEATVVYFSAERSVEIDENSLRLISQEDQGDCSRIYPSVHQFCACKTGLSRFSRVFGFIG